MCRNHKGYKNNTKDYEYKGNKKVVKSKLKTRIMKYDRSQIMKNAHRTYKYRGKKQGRTFAEVLKATWMLAKLQYSMEENAKKREAEEEARAMMLRNAKPAEVVRDNFTYEDVYGTFSNGRYVGD